MPLPQILVSPEQPRGNCYAATAVLFAGPIPRDEVLAIARHLAQVSDLVAGPRVCLAYGYGSQPRAVYRQLRTRTGLRVLWQATFGPLWLRPLASLFAGQGGLIQVLDPHDVPTLVDALSDLAMTELYSCSAERLSDVVDLVRRDGWRSFIGPVIGRDSDYFCFGVDGDAHSTPTRHVAWISYGSDCPTALQVAIKQWCTPQAA